MIHIISDKRFKQLKKAIFIRGLRVGYEFRQREYEALKKDKGIIFGIDSIEKQVAEILKEKGF